MTNIDLTPIKDASALSTKIKSIKNRVGNLHDDIWIAALSSAWHIKQDNQVTPLNQLLEACGNTVRGNAVRSYAETFMAVKWDKKAKAFKYDATKETDLPGCARKSPFEFKKPAEYKPLDFAASLATLVARAEKHLDENGVPSNEADKIPAEMLRKAKSLLPKENNELTPVQA